MQKYLEVGQIVGTHGVRGTLKVKPLTDDIKRFDNLKTVYITKGKELVEITIEEVKYSNNTVLLKLKGIDVLEDAKTYRGIYLKIERKDSVKLPKDSYFIVDLIGLLVYEEETEKPLGKVEDIYNTGSNDIYVVKDEETGKQILLPAIKKVIKKIDIDNQKIVVNLIEGLI
jgi:16S rRNA processing protein RimM